MSTILTADEEPQLREVEAMAARFRRLRPDVKLLLVTAFVHELYLDRPVVREALIKH